MSYEGIGNERLYPLALDGDQAAEKELNRRGNVILRDGRGEPVLAKERYFEERMPGGRKRLVKATVQDGRLVEGSIEPVAEVPPGHYAAVGRAVETDGDS